MFGDLSGCGWGGFAEYVATTENVLALKPSNISFQEAAAVPMAGVTALQGLRDKGKIQSGQKVLINGASGGVGIYVMTGGSGAQMFEAMALGPWISMTGSKKMGNLLQRANQKDLVFMKELLETGKVVINVENI